MSLVADGIGIDMIEPERFREAASRWGDALLDRLFTSEERAYCESMADPWPHYAARFAAKEAFVKAIGGAVRGIRWHDVRVERNPGGRPSLHVSWPEGHAPRAVLVSLTHAKSVAGAVVIVGPAEGAR